MFQIVILDDKFLINVGLGHLSTDEKKQALEDVKTALEARVGVKLTQSLSDDQVNQFNDILSNDNLNIATEWMENNIPNYREVVMQELDAIVDQIKHNNLAFIKRL